MGSISNNSRKEIKRLGSINTYAFRAKIIFKVILYVRMSNYQFYIHFMPYWDEYISLCSHLPRQKILTLAKIKQDGYILLILPIVML
jgi:phosphoglycerol transferase MdoB-like AlkP superfamily enzyme